MKTFIFDFDGTLVDSMPAYAASLLKILDDNNVNYSDDLIKIITPLGLRGTSDYVISTYNLPFSVDEMMTKISDGFKPAYFNTIPLKSNVLNTLKYLKDKGYSLNVLTANPHITLDACLKRVGVFDLFDNVWSCDDFNTTKTDINIYKTACEKIGVSVENCVFLDDNLNADMTAKNAGMTVIGVYDESSDDMQDEMKTKCDIYIYDFSELLELY